MDFNEDQLSEIDDFWYGNLSKKQKKELSTKVKSNKDLAKAFQHIQRLKFGIEYTHLYDKLLEFKRLDTALSQTTTTNEEEFGALIKDATSLNKNQELFQQFQDIEVQIDQKKIPKILVQKDKIFPWKIAAGFLLLILAGFLSYLNLQQPDPQQLATTLFETYPHPYAVRDNHTSTIKAAFTDYDFSQFKTAIPVMEKIAQDSSATIFDFHLAVAYLGNQETNKAIRLFQEIAPTLPNMQDQINWYLGLAYLKKEDITTAKKHFSMVENFKQPTIKELLKQLD